MTEKYKKFILKQTVYNSKKLLELEEAILSGKNLDKYDIKTLEGTKNQFRVRVGDFRIIFEKTNSGNDIIQINKRGDIY